MILPTFPLIAEICALLDIEVLTDLGEDPDSTEDVPKAHGVYALGAAADHAAGLRQAVVTPWFDSMNELECFCGRHFTRFQSEVASESLPDASNWDNALEATRHSKHRP